LKKEFVEGAGLATKLSDFAETARKKMFFMETFFPV
jgi:hypothetical protein